MRGLAYLFWGGVFGFVLSRTGASEYDVIRGLFTGEDWTIALLMGTAIGVGLVGMRVLRAAGGKTIRGEAITIKQKPLTWLHVLGGAIFGIGWGLSGACPGTALAQLGEGKLLALFTVAGMFGGTYLYALLAERGRAPAGAGERRPLAAAARHRPARLPDGLAQGLSYIAGLGPGRRGTPSARAGADAGLGRAHDVRLK